MDNDLNTGSKAQGRIFRTTVYGDSAAEIEIIALTRAQEFFGDGVPLEVVQDYRVTEAALRADGKKYTAGVDVRAVVQS